MLDYKDIIYKHYALKMTGAEIARQTGASKSGVNDFLNAFKKCTELKFPLPVGITNYGIAQLVYGHTPGFNARDLGYELPDFEETARQMSQRKNMALVYLWNRYYRACEAEEKKGVTNTASSVNGTLRGAGTAKLLPTSVPSLDKSWRLTLQARCFR